MRCSLPIACSNCFRSLKNDDVTIKKRDCEGVPHGGLQSRSAYHRKYGLRVGIESWEREGSAIEVQGYKWLGKPRKIQNSKRGEVGVGFLIRECLLAEVEFITNINLEECA